MMSYLKQTIFVTLILTLPFFSSWALDFDRDGLADFVLVDVNSSSRLEWSALDLNDNVRRSLGEMGNVGDHLAVGKWFGDSSSSLALVKKNKDGNFEWDIELPDGLKKISFGSYPAKVVSGLDIDQNGAIDPATVSAGDKSLIWKIIANPTLNNSKSIKEISFGGKNRLPFYANLDGRGDQIAVANVNKLGVLTIRYKDLSTDRVRSRIIGNYGSKVTAILPVAQANGKDLLFAINTNGSKNTIVIINGSKKIRRLSVKGDELVVGKYLGGKAEVLAVRSSASRVQFIDGAGNRSSVDLSLNSILADDVNINSFPESSAPAQGTPAPAPGPTNPLCNGVADSREHLLYKPVSDTTGNAVIVFDSKYAKEFQTVMIEAKDGTFIEGWWQGLELWGNPDSFGPRQHWRTSVRATQIKDNALIIANDGLQECRFILPGSSSRRWE